MSTITAPPTAAIRIKSSNDGSWCCTASLVDDGGPNNNTRDIDIQRIAGYQDINKNNSTVSSEEVNEKDGKQEEAISQKDRSFSQQQPQQQPAAAEATLLDLTKAADWMEYIEVTEGRDHDEGGAGAYDTLRCDLPLQRRRRPLGSSNKSNNSQQSSWNVWGLNFHLDRLEQSYQSLLLHQVSTTKETTATTAAPHGGLATLESTKRMICQARQDSVRMLEALLADAGRAQEAILQKSASTTTDDDDDDDDDVMIQMVRLTWLWSPPAAAAAPTVLTDEEQDKDNDGNSISIVVRGHAVCSTQPVRVHQAVQPITCTIAADAHHHHHNISHNNNNNNSDHSSSSSGHSSIITVDETLPSRVDNPQNKVASWTRLRKKLEHSDSYKPPGVSEVLLVRPCDDEDDNSCAVEILEGLSSNLFVLYRDGTLRTPTNGVLHGYVRHLVLECAASCGNGLLVDTSRPILLQDVNEWKEAFITSSSRLIFPIAKMLLHDGEDEDGAPVFREFWQDPKLLSSSSDADVGDGDEDKPKWQQLLDEILRRGGYPTNDEKNGQ